MEINFPYVLKYFFELFSKELATDKDKIVANQWKLKNFPEFCEKPRYEHWYPMYSAVQKIV